MGARNLNDAAASANTLVQVYGPFYGGIALVRWDGQETRVGVFWRMIREKAGDFERNRIVALVHSLLFARVFHGMFSRMAGDPAKLRAL